MNPPELLVTGDKGLHCAGGGFHVDPWRPVERAVITHAHSDHARRGCGAYLCSPTCAPLLRIRLGPDTPIETLAWGERRRIGDVIVSLHPAGHILGSAQVRVEGATRGETWVAAGDYKVARDAAAEPFEPVRCDVFITESTFGLPIYRWRPGADVAAEILSWWQGNRREGRTSVLLAYSLGKAQRLLAELRGQDVGPIAVHGSIAPLNEAYRAAGIALAKAGAADAASAAELRGRGLVIAPPAAAAGPWLRKFGAVSLAMASGWMQVRGARRRQALDRGFVLSDHADWPGILEAIRASGAARIGVTHGYIEPLVRYLRERGTEAFAVPTRYEGETDDASQSTEAVAPPAPGDAT